MRSEYTRFTEIKANFENNLRAGNVDWLLGSVNRIKIKRRKVGAGEQYITLYSHPIETEYDLSFYYRDYFCPSGYQFEYAMVLMMMNKHISLQLLKHILMVYIFLTQIKL